ncbi:SRPBCC domain-containing protein [Microbacterium sp. K24]|uniref:SRPBCC family protein n=1 Tax=Microbacterium sp. K24 TaxID=2305446 RepID=UPI00109D1F76|nr:SRPBCC domain-containing protein [Microbacterium sp. K24]
MSRFSVIAATSQSLSLAAMEEASRFGQRETDLDHLLLALTLSTHPAGQVLRGAGVTLDAVRRALGDQRAAQLRSLGIVAGDAEGPERIRFHETGGYEWTPRAREIFARAASGRHTGDAEAVLRELLKDQSGLIDDLLERVGTSAAEIVARLDEVQGLALHTFPVHGEGEVCGFAEAFVPASVDEVWSLLADPRQMLEWDAMTARVECGAEVSIAEAGDTWFTFAPERRPDGKRLAVRERFLRRRVEVLEVDRNAVISWRFSYPDAPGSAAIRILIALHPAAGGTQLEITLAWRRSRGWRRAVGLLFRPLRRLLLWSQLAQISGGISRAFR